MRLRTLAAAAATAALIPALAACGSNDSKAAETPSMTPSITTTATTTATATTDTSARYQATIKGLNNLAALGNQIAAAPNAADGKTLSEGLEGYWAPIEDHVKDLDSNTYIEIEDAMSALESGDASQTKQAAEDLQAAVGAFVKAHP